MNNKAIRWLYKVTDKTKWSILILTIFQLLLGLESICYALVFRGLIDSAVAKERVLFVQNVYVLSGLIIIQILLQAMGRYFVENTRSTLENRFKSRLFSVLMKRDYEAVNAVHSGEWMNRLTSDTIVVADSLVQILPGVTGMLVKMLGALIAILMLEAKLGFIIIPGGILMLLLTAGFRKQLKILHKRIQEKDGALRMFLQEHLESLLIVRSFAKEDYIIEEAESRMEAHKKVRMRRNRFSNVSNVGLSIIMQTVYIAGGIYCAYGIMQGTISYGTFTAILQLISGVRTPMTNITGYIPRFYAMTASAERLMAAEEIKRNEQQKLMEIEEIHDFYEKKFEAIELKNVSFTYLPPISSLDENDFRKNDSLPVVLNDVNLRIKKGDYIAITGQSGCGKSTLLKVLMCLYGVDKGERVLIEKDRNRRCLTGSWLKLFAYVPQGNQLLSGTIREVITFFDQSKMQEMDKLQRALEVACADKFVNNLEKGCDTVLGEKGQGLSEGQMQRIAIARAVFSDNPIMILDEATSALDEETEQQVLENLKKMTDKTVLIVTHRPAAIGICDYKISMTEKDIRMEELHREGS